MFESLISSFSKMAIGVLDGLTNTFTTALSCDLTVFFEIFPMADTLSMGMRTVAVALAFIIMIIGISISTFSPDIKSTEPAITLVIKTVGVSILIFFSLDIVIWVLSYAQEFFYAPMQAAIETGSTAVKKVDMTQFISKLTDVTTRDATMDFNLDFSQGTTIGLPIKDKAPLASLLVAVFFGFYIGINLLSLLLEVVERYVTLAFLGTISPLALATSGSKMTSNIFVSYCKMFMSQTLMVMISMWGIAIIFDTILNTMPSTDGDSSLVWLWIFMIAGFIKVMRQADELMYQMGAVSAKTGSGIMGEIFSAATGMKLAMSAVSTPIKMGTGAVNSVSNFKNMASTQAAASVAKNLVNGGSNITSTSTSSGGTFATNSMYGGSTTGGATQQIGNYSSFSKMFPEAGREVQGFNGQMSFNNGTISASNASMKTGSNSYGERELSLHSPNSNQYPQSNYTPMKDVNGTEWRMKNPEAPKVDNAVSRNIDNVPRRSNNPNAK